MELILMLVAGFIVLIIAVISVFGMVTKRVSVPTEDLQEEITNLKKRVNELEDEKKNNT